MENKRENKFKNLQIQTTKLTNNPPPTTAKIPYEPLESRRDLGVEIVELTKSLEKYALEIQQKYSSTEESVFYSQNKLIIDTYFQSFKTIYETIALTHQTAKASKPSISKPICDAIEKIHSHFSLPWYVYGKQANFIPDMSHAEEWIKSTAASIKPQREQPENFENYSASSSSILSTTSVCDDDKSQTQKATSSFSTVTTSSQGRSTGSHTPKGSPRFFELLPSSITGVGFGAEATPEMTSEDQQHYSPPG